MAVEDIRARMETYRTTGMASVEGWFDDYAAEVLAGMLGYQVDTGLEGDIAEIGVHHGKSFLLFANGARPGERVVALDVFGDQDKNLDGSGLGDRARFEENIARHAPSVDITILQASSLEVEPTDARSTFGDVRAFSIDGGHTAAITAHDLRLAESCVVPGGVVVLDDILNPHWTGVISGLAAYLAEGGRLSPFLMVGNKLALSLEGEEAGKYRAYVLETFPEMLCRRDGELLGHSIDVYGTDSPRGRREAAEEAAAVANLRRQLNRSRRARRAAEQRVVAIEHSTSWRMTAFPRLVSRRLRRIVGAGR